jgi:non-canonical purine NTP pyrophosphatase (RdgB/HAM1 family)
MQLVIASNNSHKINEIKDKFSSISDIEIIPMNKLLHIHEIVEDGKTFEENSLIKARTIKNLSNKAVLADDSGLVIDALNGEPGIFSSRYNNLSSDHEKNKLILSKMKNIPWKKRTAKFVCVIALITKDNQEHIIRGECNGYITLKTAGNHGFGYDPIFYLEKYKKTIAEIPLNIKNQISHRAIALEKCFLVLNNLLNKDNN